MHRYLKVELDNPTHGSRYREVFASLEAKLSATPFHRPESQSSSSDQSPLSSPKSFKSIVGSVSSKIGTFRSDHEKEKSSLASGRANATGKDSQTMWQVLVSQDQFISGLLGVQQRCRDIRGKKDQKEEEFRSLLAKEGFRTTANGSIPLPSAPWIYINGVNPESAKIFKSALYPALVDFHIDFRAKSTDVKQTTNVPSSYKAIVKTGDDLRQDQLVIMMIQLMDGLLKRAALDLCLTPYSILATSPTSGLVAFVEGSVPISQVLSQHNNSILQFFQASAPQSGAKFDVKPEVLSTYLRSLAGYCVITYLLGVGDRHLDNILLRSTGHFFHIDFGFIFGRDPKPLPPAFRLTREVRGGESCRNCWQHLVFRNPQQQLDYIDRWWMG
jgi:Phosphatidylinositol 3- and 4-kinase